MKLVDFVKLYATKQNVSVSKAREAIDGLMDLVMEVLKSGEQVKLPGLGLFQIKQRAARAARNPKTGEKLTIPPTKKLYFRASSDVKQSVKESK